MLGGQLRIATADLLNLLVIPPLCNNEGLEIAKSEEWGERAVVGPKARQSEVAQIVQGAERRESPNLPVVPHAALKSQSFQLRQRTDRVDSRNQLEVLKPEPL